MVVATSAAAIEPTEEERKEQILCTIAETKKTQFAHLLLFNSIRDEGNANLAIQRLTEIHANIMALHGFMAGFQFIVLEKKSASVEATAPEELLEAILVLRYLGFIFSLLGSTISLIAQEYLKSVEGEDLKFQVDGILGYSWFFRTSELLAVVAGMLLGTTATLSIYGDVPTAAFWILFVFSGFLAMWFMFYFYKIILGRQAYGERHLYGYHDKQEQPAGSPTR